MSRTFRAPNSQPSPKTEGATLVSRARILSPRCLAPLAVTLGAALAFAVVFLDLPTIGTLLLVFAYAAGILAQPELGVLGFIAIANLLPFAVIPVRLVFSFTLVDITLTALLAAWLLRVVSRERPLIGSNLDGPILLYLGLALTSFALGLAYSISPERLRLFLKSINSVLFFFSVTNCVRSSDALRRAVRALLICGAAASVVAITLLYLPEATAIELLSLLGPLGYPTGPQALRPIADTEILRAIGTSIDPNVLGGLLMMACALLVGQLYTPAPILPRRALWLMLLPTVVALLLTHSRSALGGLVVAALVVGTLRDRRLLAAMAAAALLALFLPQAEVLRGRLVSGITFQDRAALMRLDEYRDALKLISLYPWFGIGFGQPPAIDLYLGVSSIYLLIAQEMGIVGLSAFLLLLGVLAWEVVAAYRAAHSQEIKGMLLALGAALLSATSAGLLDHYFVNIMFPHMNALLWLYVGLAAVAARLATNHES